MLKSVKSGCPSTHRVINQLNLDLDDKGLIRSHGRINNADVKLHYYCQPTIDSPSY